MARTMKPRHISGTAVLAFLALAVSACSSDAAGESESAESESAGASDSLVFATPLGFDVAVTPVLYAVSSGAYEEAGLDVEVVSSNGTAQTMQQVLAGNSDIGQVVGVDLIDAVVDKDADLTAIGTADQTSPFHWISLADEPLAEPSDFSGETVGVMSIGGSSEASLDLMLRGAGLDPEDTPRNAVDEAAGNIELVAQGQIKGFMGSSDIVTLLEDSDDYDVYSFPVHDYVPSPGGAYITTTEAVTEESEQLETFLSVTKASIEEIIASQDDLSDVITSMREEYGDRMPILENEEDSAQGIVSRIEMWTANGDNKLLENNMEDWNATTDVMFQAEMISSDEYPDTMITNELLP